MNSLVCDPHACLHACGGGADVARMVVVVVGVCVRRYRGEDVARSITRATIKDARARELKAELLNNERLKVRAPG